MRVADADLTQSKTSNFEFVERFILTLFPQWEAAVMVFWLP
jgi:hypothetical protein